MNSNWSATIDIHNCNEYLSAFGRKVFGFILKHYGADEFTRGKNHFNASLNETTNSTVLLERKNSSPIPTEELLNDVQDTDIIASNNNINLVSNSPGISNSQPVFSLNIHKDYDFTLSQDKSKEFLESKKVAWEDMLDGELLNLGTCYDVENYQNANKKNSSGNKKKQFQMSWNKNNLKYKYIVDSDKALVDTYGIQKDNEKNIVCNVNVLKHENLIERRGGKYKNNSDSTKTLHEKKLKTNITKKKYTKAINSWLNDVDSIHLVDGLDIQSDAIASTLNTEKQNPDDILQASLEILEFQHKPKKMVQAQLINDNGAMKFSKPNTNKESSKSLNEENYTAKKMDSIKIKKCINAPIKSQNV